MGTLFPTMANLKVVFIHAGENYTGFEIVPLSLPNLAPHLSQPGSWVALAGLC